MQRKKENSTIRTLKGLILSILLHLLVVLLFWVSTENIFFPTPAKQEKRMTMDLSHFVPPPPPPKPKVVPVPPQPVVVPPVPITPPQPKPKEIAQQKPEPVKKILEERKLFTAKQDVQENNVTKSVEKPAKRVIEEKIVKKEEIKKAKKKVVKKEKKTPKKKVVKKAPKQKSKKRVVRRKPHRKQYTSPLANSLMGSSQSQSIQPAPAHRASSAATKRMIKNLYGSEYDGYSPEQKKFIQNNLAIIHNITQMTLIRNGYPEIAARTGQEGVNIVSFYLHPNGNITGLHLDKYMGYEALDRNTLQVIRIAYKDYPLPRKKTKIKFFVQYSINGY
jgi:TonB family protein